MAQISTLFFFLLGFWRLVQLLLLGSDLQHHARLEALAFALVVPALI